MARILTTFTVLLCLHSPLQADWWSDNGDSAQAEDIDSGAQAETPTNNQIVRDARGQGQPSADSNAVVPMMYDNWGRPIAYGMPYGYGPAFGYGSGYVANPYPIRR